MLFGCEGAGQAGEQGRRHVRPSHSEEAAAAVVRVGVRDRREQTEQARLQNTACGQAGSDERSVLSNVMGQEKEEEEEMRLACETR